MCLQSIERLPARTAILGCRAARMFAVPRCRFNSMEAAMKSSGLAVLGLSLLTAAAAHAQTTVTRQVSDMPVETTITQSPAGMTVTRRVLEGPVATEQIVTRTAVPRVSRTVTTTVSSTPARRTASRERPSRQGAMAMASPADLRAASRQTVTRTVTTRTPAPLILNADERSVIYRTIAEPDMLPVSAPVSPLAAMFPPPPPARTFPQPLLAPGAAVVTSAPVATVQQSYLVGSRLPAGVELIALPDTVVDQIPSIAPYAYATLNGHVLLVDPRTGLIVADLMS